MPERAVQQPIIQRVFINRLLLSFASPSRRIAFAVLVFLLVLAPAAFPALGRLIFVGERPPSRLLEEIEEAVEQRRDGRTGATAKNGNRVQRDPTSEKCLSSVI